jgi:hypothetical protein
MNNGHKWHFYRTGGFDQVLLNRGADLINLDQLDQKLWVALACPTRGIEFDHKTLDLIDTDKDGRIRAPEIISAAKWAGGMLKNPDDLMKGAPALALSAINDATPDGKQLLASAKEILANLGKRDAVAITVEDTADTQKIFQAPLNGDGVVPADSATDDATKTLINDIISCVGAVTDLSGKPGVNLAKVEQFVADATAYSDWWKQGEGNQEILPLGNATLAAADAMRAVKAKVDDYFARCRLAAFDARAIAALNREEKEYLGLVAKDLSITAAEVASFPLARIEAGRPLPLVQGVNPAWAAAIEKFRTDTVKPVLGDRTELTEADWALITSKLGTFESWSASKVGASVEKLGIQRVREILSGKTLDTLRALIAADKSHESEFSAIANVEKLTRYHRDLYKLLNNFVSFRDFYARKDKAVFQAGRLYLDQRSCDLCVRVEDMGKHGVMAGLSRCYLAYCECVRKKTGEKMTIVAAFTNGDSDNLMVGRNGIFYDRFGHDWDATIVKIVDNPISIRQAFWSPYKKFLRFIEEMIAKRAAAAEAASDAKLAGAAATTANLDKQKPPEVKKIDIGTVAAIGVAVGGITAALGALLQVFFGLGFLMPLGVIALVLLISCPSMVIAWLKLRQRNLGPILDANGWAVNAKAKINIPFGKSLTALAALPPGSHRNLVDPFAPNNTKRNLIIILIILIVAAWALWNFGLIERMMPDKLPKSGWMKQREEKAKAAKEAEEKAKAEAEKAAPPPAAP